MHQTQTQILLALLECPRTGHQIAWEIAKMINSPRLKEGKPADSLIYKHLHTLVKQGLIDQKIETDENGKIKRSIYSPRYGCFGGIAILKTKDDILLIISCPYAIRCKSESKENKREIGKLCRYYRYIYKEPIRIRL